MAMPSSVTERTTLKKIDSSQVFISIEQICNKKITILIEVSWRRGILFEMFN
jgi:hypothetical protein